MECCQGCDSSFGLWRKSLFAFCNFKFVFIYTLFLIQSQTGLMIYINLAPKKKSYLRWLLEFHLPVNFARIVPDGLLVFFPSYYLLDQCIACWKNIVSNHVLPNGSNLFTLFHNMLCAILCRIMPPQQQYGKEFASTRSLL